MVDHPWQPSSAAAPRQAPSDAAASSTGGERIAKALARAGVASRRAVERLIAEGRVALNGKVLDTPAVKVEPGDILTVDGAVIEAAQTTRLWRYHKPTGLVTSHGDPGGRPTVFENLPEGLPRVISIGRLDLSSEGLLLLTNDGELARALELPSNGWVRRYRARAYGRTSQAKLDELKNGVTVEGVAYGPVEARLDKVQEKGEDAPANLWITVTVTEGKNREVRRVLESLGLKVNRLIRLAYGPFALGTLPTGQVEEVSPRVIREQLEGHIAPQNMPIGDRVIAPLAVAGTASANGARREGAPAKRGRMPTKGAVQIEAPYAKSRANKAPPWVRAMAAKAAAEDRATQKRAAEKAAKPPSPGGGRSKAGAGGRMSGKPDTDRPQKRTDAPVQSRSAASPKASPLTGASPGRGAAKRAPSRSAKPVGHAFKAPAAESGRDAGKSASSRPGSPRPGSPRPGSSPTRTPRGGAPKR